MEAGVGLAPVTVDPVPAAALMTPVTIDPDGMGMRGADPLSRNPDIVRAIPAVVSGAPVPARVRPRRTVFDDNRRRTDVDVNALRED